MPVTFDILSSSQRPVIIREVDLSDTRSTASGSDCSSGQSSVIKIRILPRMTAWNSATNNDNELSKSRGGVAVPTKCSVPAGLRQVQQSNELQRQSRKTSPQADGTRKRRHISVKLFAFNCLSAKPTSVEYYDVVSAARPDYVTSLSEEIWTTTSVNSDLTTSFSRREHVGRSVIKETDAKSSQFSPLATVATAPADSLFSDSCRDVYSGQKFAVSFSSTRSVQPIGRGLDCDGRSFVLGDASSSNLASSSADFRQQRHMSRTTVEHRPLQLQLSTTSSGHHHRANHQSVKNPAAAAVDQHHQSRSCIVPSSSSSGGGLVIRRALTNFEADELTGYQNIYYIGEATCDRKLTFSEIGKRETLTNNSRNYDDNQGFYNFISRDHIAYRYEIYRLLGRGSFGQVVRAFDHKERRWVALKIIRSEDRFLRQAADEVRMLQVLNQINPDGLSHAVRMLDHFNFRKHVCIVFEPLGIDLYEALKRRRFRGFPLGAARRATKGIVSCLQLLRRQGIIHCDLKPENVLLTMPSPGPQYVTRPISVKVIDFGSSCFETDKLFVYVQSRFYRAPEVILGAGYGTPIDMWSLGCLVAELVTGRPLFPGDDEVDQLNCQMEYLGVPPSRLLSRSRRSAQFFSSSTGIPRYCSVLTNSDTPDIKSPMEKSDVRLVGSANRSGIHRGPPGSKSLAANLQDINGRESEPLSKRHVDYVDFVLRCVTWDPELRMTPDQALHHPWLQPSDDCSRSRPSTGDFYRPSSRIVRHNSTDSFTDENQI